MASTRFRMIGVALFVVALSAMEAIQWDGGPADKTNITACVRRSVSIPWSFVKADGESLLNLAWWFQAPGKEKTQIATSNNGHFYTTEKKKFGFLTNAGLSLQDANSQDSGDYSVQVQLLQADSSFASVGRTVTLSVTATKDGDLHVILGDAVRDDVTEDWIVPLYCGHFVDLGHPPVGVVWKTPSGEVRNSNNQDKGSFALSLSSSVQGGNYSCRLPPSAPAVRCLTATSPLKAAAQLYVDDKDVRLLLLEAQLHETSSRQSKLIGDLNRTVDLMFEGLSSCEDWLARDPRSGVRAIQASGQVMAVYCDQDTDKGGWTVFQRRTNDSVDFFRGWTEYRNGFGDLEGNFWLGLDKLHKLTTSQRYELRVDLYEVEWRKGYATYSGFYVDDAAHNFALHFDNFTGGNAGDSLSYHRGQQFTTKDRDHDTQVFNCAKVFQGAWWFKECKTSSLNGEYNGKDWHHGLIIWQSFEGGDSMKFTEMKIRPI